MPGAATSSRGPWAWPGSGGSHQYHLWRLLRHRRPRLLSLVESHRPNRRDIIVTTMGLIEVSIIILVNRGEW